MVKTISASRFTQEQKDAAFRKLRKLHMASPVPDRLTRFESALALAVAAGGDDAHTCNVYESDMQYIRDLDARLERLCATAIDYPIISRRESFAIMRASR